jgi:hypothetical protein
MEINLVLQFYFLRNLPAKAPALLSKCVSLSIPAKQMIIVLGFNVNALDDREVKVVSICSSRLTLE